jgi:hypothetical protein
MTVITPAALGPIATSVTSPLTLSIPPCSEPVVLVITSASAITVTGQTTVRPIDIAHTP